jgi:hypothetical protein
MALIEPNTEEFNLYDQGQITAAIKAYRLRAGVDNNFIGLKECVDTFKETYENWKKQLPGFKTTWQEAYGNTEPNGISIMEEKAKETLQESPPKLIDILEKHKHTSAKYKNKTHNDDMIPVPAIIFAGKDGKVHRKLKSAEEKQATKEASDKRLVLKTIELEYNDGKKLNKNAIAVLNKLSAADLKEVQKMIGDIMKNNELTWSE